MRYLFTCLLAGCAPVGGDNEEDALEDAALEIDAGRGGCSGVSPGHYVIDGTPADVGCGAPGFRVVFDVLADGTVAAGAPNGGTVYGCAIDVWYPGDGPELLHVWTHDGGGASLSRVNCSQSYTITGAVATAWLQ